MKLIDLSHVFEPDMSMFSEAAPPARIESWMSHGQAAESGMYVDCSCEITHVEFLTSTGTYLDSPYHFDPKGESIEALPLENLILPGVLIDCTFAQAGEGIKPDVLTDIEAEGKAVLFRTGWSRYWKQPAYRQFPFLAGETAATLRDSGAALIGIDSLVIDDLNDPHRPVHVTLLRAGIPIVENLTGLDRLPSSGFVFHAAPVRVRGAAAFPVRAYATIGSFG